MSDLSITLEDKYTHTSGRVFLTGNQALVRLPLLQKQRDEAERLNTAGFISGYRGSPLGGFDLALWQARQHLATKDIVFQPGINEDLAATAVWGSQQVGLFPGARYQGVFGLWYGKGPGVDRCGDVFRHANAAGSSRFGGVLVVAGDDHAAKSSTLPHQTEHVFKAVMMPVLYPANLQEYLDFGLYGWAMSRYSGCWVAFKALADTVETSATVDIDPLGLTIRLPQDFSLPADGLNIRWPDPPLQQEARLTHAKLYAALAFARANHGGPRGIDRIVMDASAPRLGIITAGKSYLDVRQALDELGIDEHLAAQIGIRLYKVGMVWPLEPEGVRRFAEGLEEILVVEEKRQLLEYQLKEELYNWREDVRPRVVGKFDEKGEWSQPHGEWLLPAAGELSVARIAQVIAERIQRFFTSPAMEARLALLAAKQSGARAPVVLAERKPYFCSGCPHNTSTQVPEGSRAVAGIGCHYMVTWMDRHTATFTHMGGEGVPWVGQAPFTEERHLFANLGDGTYFHSGLLAIRQAIAALAPQAGRPPRGITYKILFNDAVAMTGGQPVDGTLTVPRLARQLQAEGVADLAIVSDDPEKYAHLPDLPRDIPRYHRRELDAVQKRLREIPGVSVLIYDQTCATEKRRRRKRGKLADPAKRVFINDQVCEACGDCGKMSNCLSILPLETPWGRKRTIDQSSCNKDFSCLEGFCPSFVTVEGGSLRRGLALARDDQHFPPPPTPSLPDTQRPFNLLVTGVGGSGVVTLGAIIGMAAHMDGKGISVLDMTGLAQKYGAVFSHIRIADRQEDIHAARIATGEADAILGGDLVVTASADAQARTLEGHTRAVVNCADTPTADFTQQPDWRLPLTALKERLRDTLGSGRTWFLDAQALATRLMGDALYTNMLLLGFAWQKGMVPLSREALERAIELNGQGSAENLRAFLWGRRAAEDLDGVQRFALPAPAIPLRPTDGLEELVDQRSTQLQRYQDAAYAEHYRAVVDRLRAALGDTAPDTDARALLETVAIQYHRLLAIKDEYEVARLHTAEGFLGSIADRMTGPWKVYVHLAPPFLTGKDSRGRPRKYRFGPWIQPFLRLLARGKVLRGTWLDFFGKTRERQEERALITAYEEDMALIQASLEKSPRHRDLWLACLELARWPETVRGYGPVKAAAMAESRARRPALREALEALNRAQNQASSRAA